MIYFDNAATTKVSKEVLDSFTKALEIYYFNPSSLYKDGIATLEMESKAKKQIANCFNDPSFEVIFTSGATESNNLAIKGVCYRYRRNGNHLITTKIEHPSVLNVFRQLEKEGFEVTYLDVDNKGHVNLEQLQKVIDDQTILVSIMFVNNETGTIQDLSKINSIVRKYPKIIFHSDVTQGFGKIPFDYSFLDLISYSGHKINGFKQSGALLKKQNIDLVPLILGGGQQNNLRSGTQDVPREIALSKATRLAKENVESHYAYVKTLKKHLIEKLKSMDSIIINSNDEDSPYIVFFGINKKASVVIKNLSKKGIYLSTKSACSSKKEASSYVLEAYNLDKKITENSLRVSFSYQNTIEEIDTFISELQTILKTIK